MKLTGKKILITGGSSGIGKAVALSCADLGAEIGILADKADKVNETVREIQSKGGKARGYVCDIADLEKMKETLKIVFNDFSTLDILINNAGFATYKTFAQSSLEEIDRMSRVNYLGTLYSCKLVLDEMVKQRKGHVINVASVAGRLPITPNPIYAAAKHGVVAINELLKYEYETFGIKFSLVLPGRVDTAFFDHETFVNRTVRIENKKALPASVVAEKIVKLIERPKSLVVIPKFYSFIFWIYDAFPFITKPLLGFILKKRLLTHYRDIGGLPPK
jgi:short-subunit dehydrogenase